MTAPGTPDDLTVRLCALSDAVAAIGRPRFDDALLAAVARLIPVDHCTILCYSQAAGLKQVGGSSLQDRATVLSLGRDYVAGLHAFDPNFEELSRISSSRKVIFRRHDPARVAMQDYLRRFYTTVGIVDKVSYIWRTSDMAFYLNFYRSLRAGTFADGEVDLLSAITPLLTSIVRQHCAHYIVQSDINAGRTLPFVERLVELAEETLSTRELAVCCRIVLGYQTDGIAADLGVRPSTVITLRKRAYQKLGIASQAELFALCLRNLPRLMRPA